MSTIIREALVEDAEKLLDYSKKVGGETDNLTFGSEGLGISLEEEEGFLKALQSNEKSILICALKNNEIVGVANLSGLNRRMSHRAKIGISVLKSEWNKGIGSMLLQRLIAYAKNRGFEFINLDVRSDNKAAIRLYKKFGFQKTGVIPAFLKIDSEYIDADIMSLDLFLRPEA